MKQCRRSAKGEGVWKTKRLPAIMNLWIPGVPLEDVQHLGGHAEPRTTALYDRRQKKATRNIIESMISIYGCL